MQDHFSKSGVFDSAFFMLHNLQDETPQPTF